MKNMLTLIVVVFCWTGTSAYAVSGVEYTSELPPASTTSSIETDREMPIPEHMTVSVTGTGNTIGEVMVLELTNHSRSEVQVLELRPAYVPARRNTQAYMVTDHRDVSVDPRSTVSIAVNGVCIDPHKPPLRSGKRGFPYLEWVPAHAIDASWDVDTTAGWEWDPYSPLVNPITEEPLGHRIDFYENQQEAADFILTLINSIEDTYDQLEADGRIDTPFGFDPEQQRKTVIQQTVWITTGRLLGQSYSEGEFRSRILDLLEEMEEDADEETIDKGASDLWSSFELVGKEAKVFTSTSDRTEPLSFGHFRFFPTELASGWLFRLSNSVFSNHLDRTE